MLECNLISIISVGSRGESNVLKGHTGAVRSVRFSRDCRHLITASNDKLIKVSFDDWNVIWKIMSSVVFISVISLQIWQLPSRKFRCSLVGHSNWVRSAELNYHAAIAVSGGDDKTVKLWDVERHQCLHTFFDHTEYVATNT